MRIAIVVALVSLVAVRTARASCGSPHTDVSPPTGARLPSHPTIYLFDVDNDDNVYDSLSITRDDDIDPIKFRASRVSSGPAYTVHRIELYLLSARDRAISVRWHGQELAHYVVANDDIEPHARVVDVTRYQYSWTCSFDDVVRLTVEGNAIAYQLQWDDDRTTVVADRHVTWRSAGDGESTVVEIGHPSCARFNVEPEQLATARSFELYALFADGSSRRLGSSILQLSEDHARLPVELLRGADARLPRRFIVALTTSPQWVLACGATGGVAGAIVMLLLVRRRARLRVHQSPLTRVDA